MDWGIPTLLEAADPESAAGLCRELGFDFVEINMNLPEYQQWDIPLLCRAAERYQIYYTIHLDENLDVCYFNPQVANAYLETLLEAVDVARQIGAPILNMHLAAGVHFTLPGEKVYLYDRYFDQYKARIAGMISRCEEAATGMPLTICIENTGDFILSFKQKALESFLQSPLFGLTFDIGHDHSAGGVDKPLILEHQKRLRHFHIHDALGKKNHLPLGTGELDIPWYVDWAEKNHCRAVLEVKTAQALRESVNWLKSRSLLST